MPRQTGSFWDQPSRSRPGAEGKTPGPARQCPFADPRAGPTKGLSRFRLRQQHQPGPKCLRLLRRRCSRLRLIVPGFLSRPTRLPRHATYTRTTQVETKSPPIEKNEMRIKQVYGKPAGKSNYRWWPLRARSMSRLISRFLMSSRLSYNFLPCPRAISTFTSPRLLK